MSVGATSGATGASGTSGTSTTGGGIQTLGETDFLKLLTTQLQTQDPFNPVDNTQMIAQLAQITSSSGIAQMNQTLTNIASSLTGSRIGDVASWIGHGALVNSSVAAPLSDGSYAGRISLPSNATSVSISYVDANGAIVHSDNLGAQGAGNVSFSWNGKDAGGNVAATGPLRIVVSAADANGAITPTTATWTTIAAVQSPAGGGDTKLVTPLGLVSPSDMLTLG